MSMQAIELIALAIAIVVGTVLGLIARKKNKD